MHLTTIQVLTDMYDKSNIRTISDVKYNVVFSTHILANLTLVAYMINKKKKKKKTYLQGLFWRYIIIRITHIYGMHIYIYTKIMLGKVTNIRCHGVRIFLYLRFRADLEALEQLRWIIADCFKLTRDAPGTIIIRHRKAVKL